MSMLKSWWQILVLCLILVVLKVFFPPAFAMEIAIFSIYAMGANILMGYLGKVSFGQPVYLAFGAYGTALYLYYMGTNPLVGVGVGLLAGLLMSIAIGPILMRLDSGYFALSNLALMVIGYFIFQKALVDYTFGDDGLWFLSKMDSTPIMDLTTIDGVFMFLLTMVLVVHIVAKYLLQDSVLGSTFLAIKTNETKLRFLGYNTFNIKWLGFIIANTITALAGSLYSLYFGFVSPDIMASAKAVDPVLVTLLGGIGSLFGPIVGSFVYVGLKDMAGGAVEYWELAVGIILIVVVLQGETGIMGMLNSLLSRVRGKQVEERGMGIS